MAFPLGSIFAYMAFAVFLFGMAWRTGSWLRRPVPFALTLTHGEPGAGRQAVAVAKELLLFRSLLRGDRRLWFAAWWMHAALGLILAGHVVGIACGARQFCYVGASPETSARLSLLTGSAAGAVFVACLLVLGCRRIAIPELRWLSGPADYLVLALLLAIAVTGLLLRWGATEADLAAVRSYLGGLLTFRPVPLPDSSLFALHVTLVNVLLVYFPFSKLVHLTGGIVSQALLVRPAPLYPTPSVPRPSAPWSAAGGEPQ